MPRYCNINSAGSSIPNMLKQLHARAGGLRWPGVLYVSSIGQLLPTGPLAAAKRFLRLRQQLDGSAVHSRMTISPES